MSILKTLRLAIHVSFSFFADSVYWLLHVSLFHGRPGEILFYSLEKNDDEMAPAAFDGKVLVIDRRFQDNYDPEHKKASYHRLYGYTFENRFYRHMPQGMRVLAVWSAMLRLDSIRPLLVIEEDGEGLTPYGHYSTLPPTYQRKIKEAHNRDHFCAVAG